MANRRRAAILTDAARERVRASAEFGNRIAAERQVYGRSTGVGANRSVLLPSADAEEPVSQRTSARVFALLRSHATSAGPLRAPQRVRAALVVRINQLAAGGSGVRLEVVEALADMLASDALPQVSETGGIGTGDLAVFAAIALAVAGTTATTPQHATPVTIGPGDALAVMSSNAATLADTAIALHALIPLAQAGLAVAALTHVGVAGNTEAFSRAAERATPFPGARKVCATMRRLLSGDEARPPARIQDPFGLRTLPQVAGPLLDRIEELDAVFTRLANAPTENPLLLPDAGIAHHGGFHAAYLAQALDALRSALAQAAGLCLSRIGMLTDPAMTGLAPFLGGGDAAASGIMPLEYVAAAALSRMRGAAAPFAVQTVALSRGVEEDASFAPQAVGALLGVVADFRLVLACELVAAVRCVRMGEHPVPPGAAGIIDRCRSLPAGLADRDLSGDIAAAETILSSLAGARDE